MVGLSRGDEGTYSCAEHTHTENVECLTTNVLRSHVHNTFQAEPGADCGGSDTVLTGTCLGNNTSLAYPLGQQNLTYAIKLA